MRKIMFIIASVAICVATFAQTVSTASVIFANCTTEYVTKTKYIGEYDLPCTFENITFQAADFTTNKAVYVVQDTNQYGCDRIKTIEVNIMAGVLKAMPFTIGENKKVYFSKGNLKYQSGVVSFHYPQYVSFKNTYGSGNNTRTASTTGLDLFAFGASGYNGKAIYGTQAQSNDNIQKTNYDWAWYNSITNGGNQQHIWYTIKDDEWIYLLYRRPNALELRGAATIGGYVGMVVLPDDWEGVEGITWIATEADYTTNIYSSRQWSEMENAGAVFLPATSYCSGGVVDANANQGLNYWGAGVANQALYVDFHYTSSTNKMFMTGMSSCFCAVRAVRDIPVPAE